jgi:two-component system phosphate regulon response regulator OmpR
MNGETHILVVDDDARLRQLLSRYLVENGYMVSTAADAGEARRQLAAMAFDLIVLDVMMPGENGIDLTRGLREINNVPILLLTAMGDTKDRINGLDAGADDYMGKPFEPRELLLRIASVLRRTTREVPAEIREKRFGRFTFDVDRGELRDAGDPVYLTTAEQALLAILVRHAGETLSREAMAELSGSDSNLRTIDVQITRLRKKIEDDPRMPRHLQTVRGRGYVLWVD